MPPSSVLQLLLLLLLLLLLGCILVLNVIAKYDRDGVFQQSVELRTLEHVRAKIHGLYQDCACLALQE
jgi:hypothetical protein